LTKKQVYVVVSGHAPGIYDRWYGEGGAQEQIKGFPKPIYKGFYARPEAMAWLRAFQPETLKKLAPNLLEALETEPPAQGGDERSVADEIAAILDAGKVLIHTDGGALENPGPGGYGVVLRYGEHSKELSGGFRLTTNNRMEITACIQGLRALKRPSQVVLFSDSRYVVDSITKGWARRWQANGWMRGKDKPAENADLWAQLLDLCEQHDVEFRWLKGHAGHPDNERCDQLATSAAQGKELPADVGYEER
jgi:ribonuclease HI